MKYTILAAMVLSIIGALSALGVGIASFWLWLWPERAMSASMATIAVGVLLCAIIADIRGRFVGRAA